ncbi:ras guanine nucleotide exchange factor domain-containing protein [Aspergillus nidulans var. acristatus]
MGDPEQDKTADSNHVEYPAGLIYDNNESVRAGSLAALVEHLTHPNKLDASFNRIFLTTYTYFTSGTELVQLLLRRYDCASPVNLNPTEAAERSNQAKPLIRARVLNILSQWLENFWTWNEPKGTETHGNLLKLQSFVTGLESSTQQQRLLETIHCRLVGLEPEGMRRPRSQPSSIATSSSSSAAPKPILPRKLKPNKLQFLKIDAREIARQLTLMESCIFCKVQPNELMHKNWQRRESQDVAPNVRALIQFFNQLSGWVGALVLAESDLKSRTQVIGHFISVANACNDLQNYSAVVSILSGLQSAPVYRLGRTWAMVTQRDCDTLEPLQALISSEQNHQTYRNILRRAVPPCIPFLGLFLKDLVFIEDGNPELTPDERLINFSKYSMLAYTIDTVKRFQEAMYCLQPVPELQEYLATELQRAVDSEKMWDRSCELEPRGRWDRNRERDMYTATGGMTTAMVVACMVFD